LPSLPAALLRHLPVGLAKRGAVPGLLEPGARKSGADSRRNADTTGAGAAQPGPVRARLDLVPPQPVDVLGHAHGARRSGNGDRRGRVVSLQLRAGVLQHGPGRRQYSRPGPTPQPGNLEPGAGFATGGSDAEPDRPQSNTQLAYPAIAGSASTCS